MRLFQIGYDFFKILFCFIHTLDVFKLDGLLRSIGFNFGIRNTYREKKKKESNDISTSVDKDNLKGTIT
jgi:hypothetical protein